MGDATSGPVRLSFNPQPCVELRGATVTSDAGLLLPRDLDERLGLSALQRPRRQSDRRKVLLLLCLQLLLAGRCLAQDTPDRYQDEATGFVFPAQLGAYRLTSVTKYPDPRLGVRVRYEGFGRADAFIYDLGHAEIPTGTASRPFEAAFAESANHLARVLNTPPNRLGTKALEAAPVIQSDSGTARVRVIMYTFDLVLPDRPERPMSTWLLMTSVKNKFLKLLFSHPGHDPAPRPQEELQALIFGFLNANPDETRHFFVNENRD